MLRVDSNDATVRTIVEALGLARDDRATSELLDAELVGHPSAEVRRALARVLGGGLPAVDIRARAVEQLLRLAVDRDPGVRDWACCGLGGLYADGPEVVEVLAARLEDADGDVRDEALVALARAGDRRALSRTSQMLDQAGEAGISLLQLQAAVELAVPDLLPGLERLAAGWDGDDDEHTALLGRAMRRCAPDAAVRAAEVERGLAEGVEERLAGSGRLLHLAARYPRTTVHLHRRGTCCGLVATPVGARRPRHGRSRPRGGRLGGERPLTGGPQAQSEKIIRWPVRVGG